MRGLYPTRRVCGDGSTADGHFADRTCWRELAAAQRSAFSGPSGRCWAPKTLRGRIRNKGCSFPGGSIEWQYFETKSETACVGREAWLRWPRLESAWPFKFWDGVCVAHCANPPNQGPRGAKTPIAQSSCGAAAAEAVSELTDLSALSAALGVSASEDGLALWLCVAQPCTFSCVLLASLASPQRPSLLGL